MKNSYPVCWRGHLNEGEVDKIIEARRRMELSVRETALSVLVFGPGENHPTFSKRQQIIASLVDDGFSVYVSEEISELTSNRGLSPLLEVADYRAVDRVVVLDTSDGPLAELSLYSQDPDFVEKTLVLHPSSYVPADVATFPSDILKLYPNRIPFDQDMYDSCSVATEALDRIRAFRVSKWRRLGARQF